MKAYLSLERLKVQLRRGALRLWLTGLSCTRNEAGVGVPIVSPSVTLSRITVVYDAIRYDTTRAARQP